MTTVPAILAIPRVLAALRLILLNDAQLAAQLATAPGGGPAIYTDGVVPASARTAYLTIGPFTERSTPTMGSGRRWGSELTTPIKLITQDQDVAVNFATIDRLVALLHGVPLVVADYAQGSVALEVVVDAFEEKLAGVIYLHYPTLWRIYVGQPA